MHDRLPRKGFKIRRLRGPETMNPRHNAESWIGHGGLTALGSHHGNYYTPIFLDRRKCDEVQIA